MREMTEMLQGVGIGLLFWLCMLIGAMFVVKIVLLTARLLKL